MKNFTVLMEILSFLFCFTHSASAALTQAEQRLNQEMATALHKGVIQLGEGEQQFLAIFLEAQSAKAHGGIILLPDLGNHADWPEVISPLRKSLSRFGWHTLSIQLPIGLPTNTDIQWNNLEQEVYRRIQTAIDYCRGKRIYNIVLLGHQFGAVMASRFIANSAQNSQAISALVTLNLFSPANNTLDIQDPDILKKISLAFFDIVPARSSQYALRLAEERKLLMNKLAYAKYRQIHIIGSDYTFRDTEKLLATRIRAWLTKLAPSMEVQLAPAPMPATDSDGANNTSEQGLQ